MRVHAAAAARNRAARACIIQEVMKVDSCWRKEGCNFIRTSTRTRTRPTAGVHYLSLQIGSESPEIVFLRKRLKLQELCTFSREPRAPSKPQTRNGVQLLA
jgi:hypothetical protein